MRGRRVVSVLGVHDAIKASRDKPRAGVCGVPWQRVFDVTGTTAKDLWPEHLPLDACTLWTAGVLRRHRHLTPARCTVKTRAPLSCLYQCPLLVRVSAFVWLCVFLCLVRLFPSDKFSVSD